MIEIKASDKRVLSIGIQGENNARYVCFPETAEWKREYPHGTVSLWHRRPGEQTQYPCALEFKPYGQAVWKITAADTQIASTKTEFGTVELHCVSGDVVVKSSLYSTIIAPSLDGEQVEPPEPAKAWVATVLQAEQNAKRSELRAEAAAVATGGYIMPPWYRGVDLTEKFADEIAKYKNPWRWIRERIRAGNYEGLHICDYIPFKRTNNGQRFEAQIAGIDTYYGYGDTNAEVGHHIDFITREAVGWGRRVNANNNNGTVDAPYPWLASELYSVLNGTGDFQHKGMWDYLPYELQQYIVEKSMKLEQRYHADGLLADDNAVAWANIGKLWLPAEFEVYGSGICNRGRASTGATAVQYPIFVGNCNNRTKRVADGARVAWWLLNPAAGSTDYWCCVSNRGNADSTPVTSTYTFPVCFRIA